MVSLNDAKKAVLTKTAILFIIYAISFATRLFSVLKHESVIHEFDPYFQYRSTLYMVNEGVYNFANWFDARAWYPLGRVVGATVYPGLMFTAGALHYLLNFLHFTIDLRNVCVFLAPFMSSNTSLVAYAITKDAFNEGAGLMAGAAMALVPGYIARSVAGSYDNEAVAIFAMLMTYWVWTRACKTGSLLWSAGAAIAYFYMVSTWGGYVFLINLIPIYVLALVISGRLNHRVYVAYTVFYPLATLLSMQITFVNYQPMMTGEHLAAFGMFGLIQIIGALQYVKAMVPKETFARFLRTLGVSAAVLVVGAFFLGTALGIISPFSGRFYSLLDPTHAKHNTPIIASVSEHQPTTWASYFFDLHIMSLFIPVGVFFALKRANEASIFLVAYCALSVYFCGVMVRLMLVLAPAAVTLGAGGLGGILDAFMPMLRGMVPIEGKEQVEKTVAIDSEDNGSGDLEVTISKGPSFLDRWGDVWMPLVVVLMVTAGLVSFVRHCTWVTTFAYSSPSIVLSAGRPDGTRIIFDDFREAYYWIRMNTDDDAKILSWWDYGYQLSAMANRTTLVDNNTWNNTHIATVGQALAGDEATSYQIMEKMDATHALVIFGGMAGYGSDDIAKFLWIIRIAGSTNELVQEKDYLSPNSGRYTVCARDGPSKAMRESLMYKMSYYRFGEVPSYGGKTGMDRVRQCEIGHKDFELTTMEEAYTTEHWLVRVYKRLPRPSIDGTAP